MWQSYEAQNQGIVLTEPMADQLNEYLSGKEGELSNRIVELILLIEGIPSLKDTPNRSQIKLSDAVEEFSRKVAWASQSSRMPSPSGHAKLATRRMNETIWAYVEVLEGCVVELFQQLDQIGFEHWNVDLVRTTTSIKDELNHRLDDLLWAIRRLEQQLKLYNRGCESREGKWTGWRRILAPFSKCLDRSLEPAILKCSKFLNFRYRKFIERYAGYLQMHESVQEKMDDLYGYRVLSSMDIDQQDKIKQLCFYLNLWEQNNESRMLQRAEPVRAVRSCLTPERTVVLFQEYASMLRNALFDKSRLIKQQFRHMFIEKESREPILDNIAGYRTEIQFLNALIGKYRKFVTQTEGGLGENESIVDFLFKHKKEPRQVQELKKMMVQLMTLDGTAASFYNALQHKPVEEESLTPEIKDKVNDHLHEMAQPLASKDLMRTSAKGLIAELQGLDEIGSFDPNVVRYVCRTLSKAMCKDWKYHVLQEIPAFHTIYDTHRQIISLQEDRQHQIRFGKFQRVLSQLEGWVKSREMGRRAQEIELDINDIKAYLQDYLASVQRLEPRDSGAPLENDELNNSMDSVSEAFLQYLHLFGSFFSRLDPDRSEHRLLRRHLLFIDQYFEEIDRKLQAYLGS